MQHSRLPNVRIVYQVTLLSPSLLHSQDLYHADKDVDEVQLQRDRLIYRIAFEVALLCGSSMVQNLLNVV